MADFLSPLGNATLMGVSVQESDGTIDYERVRRAGFSIVYLRASSGADYADCRLKANVDAANRTELEVGFFHVLTARTEADARAQAQFFLQTISGFRSPLRAAVRFNRFRGLDIQAINAIAQAFLSEVEGALGAAPMLLTDAAAANALWRDELAMRYPLWVAEPDVSAPEVQPGKWGGWTGWLYAELGDVDGADLLPLSLFTPNVHASQPALETKLICVTVAYGDTLSAIGKLFGVSVDEIARINALSNPDRIYPGQRLYLRVPASTPVACCDVYTVRRGDTLSSIARRFNTTIEHLARVNAISNPDRIRAGQVLNLGLCEGV